MILAASQGMLQAVIVGLLFVFGEAYLGTLKAIQFTFVMKVTLLHKRDSETEIVFMQRKQ